MSREHELLKLWRQLNETQQDNFLKWMKAYEIEKIYVNHNKGYFNQKFIDNFGDRLITHYFNSNRPLTKTLFEHAFNDSLNESGMQSQLAESRTNPGYDITIQNIKASLKTEAARNISQKNIHVSKWMELGKGKWVLEELLARFLAHLNNYDKIFTLRYIKPTYLTFKYQLIEIPKTLLLESKNAHLVVMENSTQDPKPGYGYVFDQNGEKKFSLYFDGGSERKLQIKHLNVSLCIIHAEWCYTLPS
ncbi:hypothetical protein ACN9PN_28905 [Klebsiella pasteurii]|jgi:hypothetical protein|nr:MULTISPECIES: hypothetical protein [Klebsiella]ELT9692215.1 hypothetical protein [Klebsiella michiganensis]HAX0147365.1 restriction endonuclease [Escherichia coli JJ2087]HAX0157028.1 restriction endonuclease [Escherichia coli JJ2038]HAX0180848.1 restriction endonuclease [Escherichia coli JJ1908]ART03426.1 hypothetical protein B8O09_30620 [Klebsiella pneumoniae]